MHRWPLIVAILLAVAVVFGDESDNPNVKALRELATTVTDAIGLTPPEAAPKRSSSW